MALAPVAEGPGGGSGDVLDVVGDESGAAGAEKLVQALDEVRLRGRSPSLNGSLGELVGSDVLASAVYAATFLARPTARTARPAVG
ncbi:hypothetical protein ACIRYZ_28525 [Kitasatospora sp. NPDC101155]|uniref:hypothetical protein n=1 Tax=Kitasatospora sp. NPDC101155 TaxID=3364097 RepID=UPI00380FCDCC